MVWIIPNSSWTNENKKSIDNSIHQSRDGMGNTSLIFDKYLQWRLINKMLKLNIKIERDRIDCKEKHFKKVINLNLPLTEDQYTQLKNKKNSLPNTFNFILTTRTRLIVNHGDESIMENSVALHPYYGLPIIPGSAIKGVTRHYCKEFLGLDDDSIKNIFGNIPDDKKAEEGSIIFYDAWPEKIERKKYLEMGPMKNLKMDVFTPHYKDYYQDGELPRDDQSPVPVNFLAVMKDVPFEFSIAPSSRCRADKAQNLIYKTVNHITDALTTFGIGAKTGSNYGYFK